MRTLPLLLAAGLASGCASTSPKAALDDASALVAARTGSSITWHGDDDDIVQASRRQAEDLLAHDLTLAGAVRVTLLENRSLQSSYEELGLAQADLVQAGLLKNPTFDATYDFPLDGSHSAFALGFVTDLVQLMTLGSRKAIAERALAATKYRVTSEVVRHVYDTKVAYYTFQAAQETLAMQRVVHEAALAAVLLARRQHESGATSDLDLANEEALFAQVTTDVRRAEAEVAGAREHLTRVMGVYGPMAAWRIAAPLGPPPDAEPSLAHVESRAVAARLDLAAAHADVEVVSYALALAKNARWTGAVDAGVDFHREAEGVRLLGPSVSVSLPLFDQGQATIARVEAELRRAKHREAALAIDVRSEVRELVARLAIARSVVDDYRRNLVPTRERVVALSQEQYDAMLLGVFQLLTAKREEVLAYRELIGALREYWTLRAELEWKLGGSLEDPAAPPHATSPAPAASPSSTPPKPGAHVHDHLTP